MKLEKSLADKLSGFGKIAFIVGAVCMGLFLFTSQQDPSLTSVAYLVSYLFWAAITIGSLAICFIHCLTGGNWGYPIRRTLEITTKLFPLMLVLFIPIYLNMHSLYEWTHADVVAHDTLLQHKQLYLNENGFTIRLLVYFGLWILLAFFLRKISNQFDGDQSQPILKKMQGLGGVGVFLYAMTVTFSSVDWAMSLEPHWFSTIYGVLFMIGNGLAAIAFAIFCLSKFQQDPNFAKITTKTRCHDLGTLMFAIILLWAYVNVSQLVIMWSGNLAEEAPWYMKRVMGGWQFMAIFIVIFHFFVPFFILIIRENKKKIALIGAVAAWMLFMRYIDLYWYIKPAFSETLQFHYSDALSFIGIGGLWIGSFLFFLKKDPVLYSHDPYLTGELTEDEHH